MVSPAGCGIVTFVAEASLTSFSEQALVALTYTPQSKRARLSRRSNCIQPPVFAQHADSGMSSGRRTNL